MTFVNVPNQANPSILGMLHHWEVTGKSLTVDVPPYAHKAPLLRGYLDKRRVTMTIDRSGDDTPGTKGLWVFSLNFPSEDMRLRFADLLKQGGYIEPEVSAHFVFIRMQPGRS